MKVLHVVESLHRGAVENWLIRMLGHARKKDVDCDWTFYCALPERGDMEKAARDAGARIIRSPVPIAEQAAFIRMLRQEMRRGRYDVIHCHHDLVSAIYLIASVGLPIRRRIVHVHNEDEVIPTQSAAKAWLVREPFRSIALRLADRVVGISNHTLETFLGGRKRRSGRDRVHYYGVDPAPFVDVTCDRVAFRRSIGLADDCLILLFAGRVVAEKNPEFCVDVLAEILRHDRNVALVFAGAGGSEASVTERARSKGVAENVRMLGWRSDLPEIMKCSDLFLLPRPEKPREGFGLAVVEAQLAGLRLLLSRGIADDPLLPTAVYRRLSLSDGAERWADAARALLREPRPHAANALQALKSSPFEMDFALQDLVSLHA